MALVKIRPIGVPDITIGETEKTSMIETLNKLIEQSNGMIKALQTAITDAQNQIDLIVAGVPDTIETIANDVIAEAMGTALAGKVDVIEGKQLSTEDYTTAEKTKLAGIATGAQVNTVTSVAGRTGAVTLAKSDVGLSSVDNTSDSAKPVSTAQQTALDLKVNTVVGKQLSTEDYTTAEKTKLAGIATGAQVNTVTSVAGRTGAVTLAKSDVGLSSVDNTSDSAKPVSTAQQTALNLKADITQPGWTGASFQNGARQYSGQEPVAYKKGTTGLVELKGVIVPGALNTVMFTLPSGYYSSYTRRFPVNANNAIGFVDIQGTGGVVLKVGSLTNVDLSSIKFTV